MLVNIYNIILIKQAMVGVDEMLSLKKEAAANFIMCSSWGDNHGARKERYQHVHWLALLKLALYGTRNISHQAVQVMAW